MKANFWIRHLRVGWLGILAIVGLTVAGCGHDEVKTDPNAFAGAAPAIKAAWDQAVAADQAANYNAAVTDYNQLMRQQDQLTADQVKVVRQASNQLLQRIMAGVNQGDPKAKQAMDTLRSLPHGP